MKEAANQNTFHDLKRILCLTVAVTCLALSIPYQASAALTEISWLEDNPEGAAVVFKIWPSGGQQDFAEDTRFAPLISPGGFWDFSSFLVDERLGEPIVLEIEGEVHRGEPVAAEIKGVLRRVDSTLASIVEIPFSFGFDINELAPGIFTKAGAVYFPIEELPEGIDTLTFVVQAGSDDMGIIYGIAMGVGLEPASVNPRGKLTTTWGKIKSR